MNHVLLISSEAYEKFMKDIQGRIAPALQQGVGESFEGVAA
jgi:hypothetical protein